MSKRAAHVVPFSKAAELRAKKKKEQEYQAELEKRVNCKNECIDVLVNRLQRAKVNNEAMILIRSFYAVVVTIWDIGYFEHQHKKETTVEGR